MNDGTGRSLFDYDDDGRLDIFVVNGAPLIGVAAGDYDNDGYEDLYVTANMEIVRALPTPMIRGLASQAYWRTCTKTVQTH